MRFRCRAGGCNCARVVEARLFLRGASRIYEYQAPTLCHCGHNLFTRHDAGEMGETAQEDRAESGIPFKAN